MEIKDVQSELAVIKQIMEDTRKINVNNGIHYIFWGILVAVCLIANYVLVLNGISMNYVGYLWLIAMTAGAVIDGFIGKYQTKINSVNTFAGKLLSSVWFASGISMFIFGFVGVFAKAYNPIYICPIISTSLGISYFVSGAIQQIKWFKYISLGWWLGSILLFVFPSIHTLLIFAFMLIVFQVIPGIIIRNKSKSELGYKTV